METKDLVLLVMIPLLLIGLVWYTEKSPITGAVVADTGGNKVIGTYSIMPNFKASMDYEMQKEYQDLNSKLKLIIEACKSRNDVEDCVNKYLDENHLDWKCPAKDSDILGDFVDSLTECKNLYEENAVCRFSVPKNERINGGKNSRNFEINLTGWYYPQIKAELIENGKILETSFVNLNGLFYTDFDSKDKESPEADSVKLKLAYNNGIPSVEKFSAATDSYEKDLSKIFLIYKSKDTIKFVDVNYEPSFRSTESGSKTGSLKTVTLPKTKGMEFCAKSGKKVFAYDDSEGLVQQRNIIYNFAIAFFKPAPKPVENLEVLDNLKAENSAVLVWSKSKEDGVSSYSIYYSTKQFDKMKTDEIKNDKEIYRISVPAGNFIEIENIDLMQCDFSPTGEACKYNIYNKNLEKNKLYYWKSQDKLIYLIGDAQDKTEYNFAVNAANEDGEEIDNDISIEGNSYVLSGNNYKKFTPIDDLAPSKIEKLGCKSGECRTLDGKLVLSWDKPTKNLDGTTSFDIKGFNIYYKKPNLEIPAMLDLTGPFAIKKFITSAEAKCDSVVSSLCEYDLANIKSLEKGQPYIFAIIATDSDTNGNEYKDDIHTVAVIP